MTQTIVNLGTGGAALNGQNGSTGGADSNDALFLDWTGLDYVYLPGVAGNFMSVPDEAALDITGDIDIRVRVALDSWTSTGADTALMGKYTNVGNQSSYLFLYGGDVGSGLLRFFWTEDGAAGTFRNADSTASVALSDGEVSWVRLTIDVDNGASGRDIKFWKSSDNVTYTQVGATITQAGTTSIYSGTANAIIGAYNGGATSPAAGKFYAAQIYNGIAGSKVLDIDTAVISSGSATTFTALTGQTVTIGRGTTGRKTVAVVSPVWLLGTDDYIEVADNALLDFGATDSFTVVAIVRQWATTDAFAYPISKQDSANDKGYSLRNFSGDNVYAIVGDGTNTTDTSASPQSFTLGALTSAGVIVNRTGQTLRTFMNGTLGTTSSVSAVGDTSNSQPLQVGRNAGFFTSQEVIAVSVFRRALTATEITQITAYYQARLS